MMPKFIGEANNKYYFFNDDEDTYLVEAPNTEEAKQKFIDFTGGMNLTPFFKIFEQTKDEVVG